jgi:hypothetical protein
MYSSRLGPLLVAGLTLALPCLRAQAVADATGHWVGAIHAPFGDVNIEIDLAKNGKGQFAATFGNLMTDLRGLPLSDVAVEEKSIYLLLKANSGGGEFEGALSADGKAISGDFITTDGGFHVPFSLTRTGDPQMESLTGSAPIGKELEGAWKGTLDVDGTKTALVLRMSNEPGGTSFGTIVNASEGLEFSISNIIQKASHLTFELKAMKGVYSGEINAGGTALAGTYTQGTLVQPVIFRRANSANGKE